MATPEEPRTPETMSVDGTPPFVDEPRLGGVSEQGPAVYPTEIDLTPPEPNKKRRSINEFVGDTLFGAAGVYVGGELIVHSADLLDKQESFPNVPEMVLTYSRAGGSFIFGGILAAAGVYFMVVGSKSVEESKDDQTDSTVK